MISDEVASSDDISHAFCACPVNREGTTLPFAAPTIPYERGVYTGLSAAAKGGDGDLSFFTGRAFLLVGWYTLDGLVCPIMGL